MTGITILRRDGTTVLFRSETATTLNEVVAEAKSDLRYADLRSADLYYADLRSADLRSADLYYADLRSADLRSADLRSADLSYADLRSADLSYADLRYTDLRSADLSYANLSSADLSYANLSSADLSYANLSYADLRSANLSYATGIGAFFQIGPIDLWWMSIWLEEEGWKFRAGCRYFSEAEARDHWGKGGEARDPVHGARMLAGVKALIALAKTHEWPEKLVVEKQEEIA